MICAACLWIDCSPTCCLTASSPACAGDWDQSIHLKKQQTSRRSAGSLHLRGGGSSQTRHEQRGFLLRDGDPIFDKGKIADLREKQRKSARERAKEAVRMAQILGTAARPLMAGAGNENETTARHFGETQKTSVRAPSPEGGQGNAESESLSERERQEDSKEQAQAGAIVPVAAGRNSEWTKVHVYIPETNSSLGNSAMQKLFARHDLPPVNPRPVSHGMEIVV
jgi:hypothetical protein